MDSATNDRGPQLDDAAELDSQLVEQFCSDPARQWRVSDLVRNLPGADVLAVAMSLERLERRGRLVRCEPGCYQLGAE